VENYSLTVTSYEHTVPVIPGRYPTLTVTVAVLPGVKPGVLSVATGRMLGESTKAPTHGDLLL